MWAPPPPEWSRASRWTWAAPWAAWKRPAAACSLWAWRPPSASACPSKGARGAGRGRGKAAGRVGGEGLGNVGGTGGKVLAQAGARVVAVQDHTGTIGNDQGLDMSALLAHVQAHGGVDGFAGADRMAPQEFWGVACEIL